MPSWSSSPCTVRRTLSGRNSNDGAQAAERRIAEGEVAAMAAQDVARDGEAEAGAAGLFVARAIEAEERLEHLLAAVLRHAGAVVVDHDLDAAAAGG